MRHIPAVLAIALATLRPAAAWFAAGRYWASTPARDHGRPRACGAPLMSMMPRDGDRLPRDEDGPDRRLPLSYRTDNGSRDSEFYLEPLGNATADAAIEKAPNPFFDIVAQLSPSELTSRFVSTAPEYVQGAVRTTILGLLGSIGKYAFETATVTSAERLANLMFQLQMTGYMFKNAEYRLSITESLEGLPQLEPASDGEDAEVPESGPLPKVEGKIRVQMSEGMEVEVDADAYMAELRQEVEQLRGELVRVQADEERARIETGQADLLAFVRTLPDEQMLSLTSQVSDEVLDAMKRLVAAVMSGMGASEVSPSTLMQQSGSAMKDLVMWQLVVGYNLREMEVREEMRRAFLNSAPDESDGGSGDGAAGAPGE